LGLYLGQEELGRRRWKGDAGQEMLGRAAAGRFPATYNF
jgi:hypothetical protein